MYNRRVLIDKPGADVEPLRVELKTSRAYRTGCSRVSCVVAKPAGVDLSRHRQGFVGRCGATEPDIP